MMKVALMDNLFLIAASTRLRVSMSPVGRALLVAALLISAYALVRYWRSLGGRSGKVRYTLISLRAVALLLVAGALSGLSVEYETAARARVLLRRFVRADEALGSRRQANAGELTIAALQAKGFEVAEAETEAGRDEGFAAGVLLTDGAMSTEEAQSAVERMSVAVGAAPVFVVADSATHEEPGVALEGVTVLGNALRGVPVQVSCTVRARGMLGRESLLTVSDDAKVQASARVAWTSNDERQVVTVSVVPKVAGWIDYRAKVEAAGNEDESLRVRSFTVYAEERRLRVLFFESEPTWEAKFIRRALEQSGLFEVDYSAQVSRAATVGIAEEAAERNEEPEAPPRAQQGGTQSTPEARLRRALQSASQLNSYDCVIVGATENGLLSTAESARLREWVERRGGGLVVLGGNSFNGSIAAPGGKLYSLLPAETGLVKSAEAGQEVSRGRPLEAEKTRGVVQLTPTEAGASGALGGYLNASVEGRTKTSMLTGQGLRLGNLRPGAKVLAVAGQAGADGTGETGAALIAAMRYGLGRTLLFAPADSWRIRTSALSNEEDDAGGAFNALWQGIVLWTAANARSPVEIILSDDSPAEGSSLTAEIRARAASFASLKIERLSARLQPLTEDASDNSTAAAQPRELAFAPDETDASVWRARFSVRARGRYALEIEYTAGGQNGRIEKYFTSVAPSAQGAGAAFDTLRRAARERGGELVSAADINALVERLVAASSSKESVRRVWELRTWWPLAFLVPLLLSTEWFMRRRWKED
jgi:hypothetical protein